MTRTRTLIATTAVFVALLSLSACKRKEAATAEPTQAPPAAPAAEAAATPPPAATGKTAGASTVTPFDPHSVPVSNAKLPPFPYVERPKGTDGYHDEEQQFDRIYVVAGKELRPVEGHYQQRWFPPRAVKMSLLEAYRNYDNAFRALGAVRVDAVGPADPEFVARNGEREAILKRLRLPNLPSELPADVPAYAQYLLRTPDRNIWLSFSVFDDGNNVSIMTLEEKPMQQTVAFIQAGEMASALGREGHIALYLNFDTDSDVIRSDSQAAVGEIAKLLRTDAQLKLQVEGHTDSSGDPARNRELSRRRAESVVRAVTALGIDGARLRASGVGADKPLAGNDTEEGRARNRRVELVKA
jgi:outer membrane protein OmpA-like peptidoglycan-associated protein